MCGGVVCAGMGCLWGWVCARVCVCVCVALGAGRGGAGRGGAGGGVWLRMRCVGRDRGAGDSHSQAKDNAVCVGWGGGGEFVVCGVCRRAGCVCVSGWICVCAQCAGGVCVRVCVRCVGCRCGCGCGCGLWVRGVTVAQRQRPRDTARQRTRQCVGGRGGRDVCAGVLCALVEGCLWAGLGVASACGVWAETEGRRRVTAGPRTT